MMTNSMAELQSFFQKASLFVWDWHLEVQQRIHSDIDSLIDRGSQNPAVSDEEFGQRYHYLKTQLANTHRYSVLPMILGVFERAFIQYCRLTIANYRDATRSKRGGWFPIHCSLLNSHGVDLSPIQDDIDKIIHLIELRHCVTHAFGEIAACKRADLVRRAIAAIEDTSESSEGFLFVNPQTIAAARVATRFTMVYLFNQAGYPTDHDIW